MADKVEGAKHIQVILEEAHYQVLKLALIKESNRLGRNVTIREFTEKAVLDTCLSVLGVSELTQAVHLMNAYFGDEEND